MLNTSEAWRNCFDPSDDGTRHVSDRQLSVAVKHFGSMFQLVREDLQMALIVEDNVEFPNVEDGVFQQQLQSIIARLPQDFDFASVSPLCVKASGDEEESDVGDAKIPTLKRVSVLTNTTTQAGLKPLSAYLVSHTGALRLLKTLPMTAPLAEHVNDVMQRDPEAWTVLSVVGSNGKVDV